MPKKPPPHPPKSHYYYSLPMALASLFLLSLISTLSFFLSSAAPSSQIVIAACKATRYPDLCQSSLLTSTLPTNPTSLQIIQSAIAISDDNLKTASSMSSSILQASSSNPNRTAAANNCLEFLSYSHRRMASTLTAASNKDARAWMSAALLYQYDCWSALKYVNGTKLVAQTMSFLDQLMGFTSNALSMIFSYDNFGPDIASWAPPKTERDGFYEGGSDAEELGVNGGVPSGLTADVAVCKGADGGCYKTVQEAVNAAPDDGSGRRFVIRIKEGVYEETVRVPFEKKNVVFLGDGMGKTVITGSLNVGLQGLTTYQTATLGVAGDGFMASGVTIMNTAGPDAHQAVAFRSDSDHSIIENCEFIGNQDTLYAHGLRQFYKNCRIQGNVDFIFGNSASVFQGCEILVSPRQVKPEKGETNAITAHGRTDPAQLTGFVFHKCSLNGTEDYIKYYNSKPKVHKTYLGRPWKEYSRTVFINCNLEALIRPEGWLPWSRDFALKTLFFGEFGNTGPGSQISQRVSWSTQIPTPKLASYSLQNFIQGHQWIPPS